MSRLTGVAMDGSLVPMPKKSTPKATSTRAARSQERKQRMLEHTRREILEAAVRALAKHGPTSTTVHHIASEAGFTAASLYTYFPSRDAIIEALAESMIQQAMAIYELAPPEGLSFERRLEWFIRQHLSLVDSHREAFGVFTALLMSGAIPEGMRRRYHEEQDVGFLMHARMTREWLSRHASARDLGGRAPEDVAFILVGIGVAFFVRWRAGPPDASLVDRAPEIVQVVLHGIKAR
ncbi:MAG: TetR/AcrR family transcriptional regulator [Myxococcota bacterium]